MSLIIEIQQKLQERLNEARVDTHEFVLLLYCQVSLNLFHEAHAHIGASHGAQLIKQHFKLAD